MPLKDSLTGTVWINGSAATCTCQDGRSNFIPILRIPYPDTRVQATCRYSVSVKGDSVDLAEVALQGA